MDVGPPKARSCARARWRRPVAWSGPDGGKDAAPEEPILDGREHGPRVHQSFVERPWGFEGGQRLAVGRPAFDPGPRGVGEGGGHVELIDVDEARRLEESSLTGP